MITKKIFVSYFVGLSVSAICYFFFLHFVIYRFYPEREDLPFYLILLISSCVVMFFINITFFWILLTKEHKRMLSVLLEEVDPRKLLYAIEKNKGFNRAPNAGYFVACNLSAIAHTLMGNDQLAGTILAQALSVKPALRTKKYRFMNDPILKLNLMFIMLRSGLTEEADRLCAEVRTHFSTARLHPRSREIYEKLFAEWDSKRFGRHEEHISFCLRDLSDPKTPRLARTEASFDLAGIALEKGDLKQARYYFTQVVSLTPDIFIGAVSKERLRQLQGDGK